VRGALAILLGAAAALLAGCATASGWSAEQSRLHLSALDALSYEALGREYDIVLRTDASAVAPPAYVVYAFAVSRLDSEEPGERERGLVALVTAAFQGTEVMATRLRPRAGDTPVVEPYRTVRPTGLPEAQYRLYQEWIDDPDRTNLALEALMYAALADYPPALEAWEREEQAGRFDGDGR